MARSRPRFKKQSRKDLSKKGVYERSVRQKDDFSYFHFTKGPRLETKYERLQRESSV